MTTGMDEDLAYAVLGMDEKKAMGAIPDEFATLVLNGRRWLEEQHDRLQPVVCRNLLVRDFISHGDVYSATTLLIELIPGLLPAKGAAIALLCARGLLVQWCPPLEETEQAWRAPEQAHRPKA